MAEVLQKLSVKRFSGTSCNRLETRRESSYEPTRLTVGQAATTAPTGP